MAGMKLVRIWGLSEYHRECGLRTDGKVTPKGIKQVLMERGIWREGLKLECKENGKMQKEKNIRGAVVGKALGIAVRILALFLNHLEILISSVLSKTLGTVLFNPSQE